MKQRFSVTGMDVEVIEMLAELREYEGRFVGRILGDAVREYHASVLEYDDVDQQDL